MVPTAREAFGEPARAATSLYDKVFPLGIRLTVLGLGVWLAFFPPERMAHHLVPRIVGALFLASGILGHHAMGAFQTAVLLSLVYFLTMGPMRLVAALRRDDALDLGLDEPSFWKSKARPSTNMDERQRLHFQF